MRAADLSDLRVGQLRRAEPGQGPVQLEQLQRVAAEAPAHQEPREARRQEEQGADVSLRLGTETLREGGGGLGGVGGAAGEEEF